MIQGASNSRDPRAAKQATLAYVLGFFTAIPLLLTAGNDRYLKFHAWQSIIWSTVVAGVIVQLLALLSPGLRLPWFFTMLAYLLLGAFTVAAGKEFRMPVVADFVDKRLVK